MGEGNVEVVVDGEGGRGWRLMDCDVYCGARKSGVVSNLSLSTTKAILFERLGAE